ncbi:MAG: OsmC family protein [Acidobacteria bacterium]|nr:OsmC family protein [Acidobacteriota bacterium]
MAGPTTTTTLTWTRELQFDARSANAALVLDGKGIAGPSPVDALAAALAGCMAIDVVDIVTKGRHELRGLEATLSGERAADPPRRFLRVTLHFVVTGAVPAAAMDRALQLSRDKYCSVWHSLRQDIEMTTTYEVRP